MTDLSMAAGDQEASVSVDRRFFMGSMLASTAALTAGSLPSFAAESETLESYLYRVLRVREATQQERRLIKSGKFKDIQRANVKLAVRFMVQNYRLGDAVVGASAYLSGGSQMKAIDAGNAALQNLETILDYYDTSDVENLKVSGMAGKEDLVLQGLQTGWCRCSYLCSFSRRRDKLTNIFFNTTAQSNIDQFLTYFPEATVQVIKDKIFTENDLNIKEFDKSLGDILNLPPPS